MQENEMIKQKDIIADLHTHSIASLHAFSTYQENLIEARNKGLEYLAVTDHYYGFSDIMLHNNEIARLLDASKFNKHIDKLGVRLIPGVELNVQQSIPEQIRKNVIWRPEGLHSWFLDMNTLSFSALLAMLEEDMVSGKMTALAHIERGISHFHKYHDGTNQVVTEREIIDFLCSVIYLCEKYNIPMELNETSLTNEGHFHLVEKWLDISKQRDIIYYLGSDAHISYDVGVFPQSIELLNRFNVPEEKVINCNRDLINMYVV